MTDVRVLIVDDHRIFTELLGFALDSRAGLRCVARARTVSAALMLASITAFDAAIIDIQLPDGNGLDLAVTLQAQHPAARIVALTAVPSRELLIDADRAGIPLLSKDGSFDAILAALGEGAASDAATPMLTPREREVLELLSEGLDAGAIARALEISLHTARGHLKLLLQKTGTRSQVEALAVARRQGLLDPLLTT